MRTDDLRAELADLIADLSDAVIATDFDGTMSPIVSDPGAAELLPGAAEALLLLSDRVGEIVVVSGRPVSFLSKQCPSGLTLVGLYGLESVRDGQRVDHPTAGVWRETMADVATAAELQGPDGMLVELKGLSITLHYRGRPDLEGAVQDYSAVAAKSAGLRRRPARMSVELHPPIDEDKGTVILRLAEDHSGPVLYMGDDVGDLPAFDALDQLASAGRTVLRIVAQSDEMDDELRDRADLLVDGPPGAVALLRTLADC